MKHHDVYPKSVKLRASDFLKGLAALVAFVLFVLMMSIGGVFCLAYGTGHF